MGSEGHCFCRVHSITWQNTYDAGMPIPSPNSVKLALHPALSPSADTSASTVSGQATPATVLQVLLMEYSWPLKRGQHSRNTGENPEAVSANMAYPAVSSDMDTAGVAWGGAGWRGAA